MRKLKVYLDTSVVSYLYQEDAFERMQDTLALWELFRQGVYEVYISDLVLREIDRCTEEKLKILLDYMKQIKIHVIKGFELISSGFYRFQGRIQKHGKLTSN